jgi:RNA polymerase sigma-70 factor (ECF subfamily)
MDRNRQTGDVDGDRPLEAAWEEHRRYLLNIAYRLLGSLNEAEDMVQEAYVRLMRSDVDAIDDVRGWLVVVTTRICLDHLGSARSRREARASPWFPEPIIQTRGHEGDPADIVILDESVRMALLIVLERLKPAERVVFVLHDVFQYSFEEIAPMVDRSPAACRQLASRARRRMSAEKQPPQEAVDPEEMRQVAERFIAACAGEDLQLLLDVLDPAVVGWVDLGRITSVIPQPAVGAAQVATGVMSFFGPASRARLSLAVVNGETGIIASVRGRPTAVMVFYVRDALITAVYAIADPEKLARIVGQ